MGFTVDDLLISIKLRSFAPISQATFSNSDLLIVANEEMLTKIVPDILGVRENFFLTSKTVPIIANESNYTLPKRAIGQTLKALSYVTSGGDEYILEHCDYERAMQYNTNNSSNAADPACYYFAGDEVVLVPTPAQAGGSIKFVYFAKPNELVLTESGAQITNIVSAAGTTTFTVDTDLTASLSVGDEIDIVSSVSPYLLWSSEVAITAITSTTIAVATADVDNAAGTVEAQVGDYICVSGESNYPMLPQEFHPILAQASAVRLLGSLGDLNKLQLAKAELEQMRAEGLRLIKNRVETSPIKVSGRNNMVSIFRGGF